MAVKNPLWFWGAFLLFFALMFAVGLPVMMYGQASYPVPLDARVAPAWALTMLAVSLCLWLGLLYVYVDTLVLAGVRSVRRMHDILTRGEPRNALIEQVVSLPGGVDGFPQLRLRLAFDNLSGTPISDELVLVDSKPMQRRYEVGRTLPARSSRSPGPYPNMSLEGGTPEINSSTLWLRASIGVLFVAVVASAYGVAWQLQNDGLGWTFLSLGHPLLICPLVLWVFVVGIRLLMRRLQADAAVNALKYRGVGTVAIIDDVRQTGAFFNEQPQVEFQLRFNDVAGQPQRAVIRRYVPLIDLATIPRDTMQILYDPKNPSRVQMDQDAARRAWLGATGAG